MLIARISTMIFVTLIGLSAITAQENNSNTAEQKAQKPVNATADDDGSTTSGVEVSPVSVAEVQAPVENPPKPERRSNEASSVPFLDLSKLKVDFNLSAKSQYESVESFPVHVDGAHYDRTPESYLQLRVGLNTRYDFAQHVFFKFNYEHDLISRRINGGELSGANEFTRTDGVVPSSQALRELNAEFRYKAVAIATGYAISNWGLGLLANGGRGDWTPKSAYFGSPYGGDRVFRTRGLLGPIPQLRNLLFMVAYDKVIDDDILVEDDTAQQLVAAVVVEPGKPNTLGMYAAFREQLHSDNKATNVAAYDVYGKLTRQLNKDLELQIEAEGALIVGETDLGPNPTFEKHDVLQAGALLRTKLSHQTVGLITDLLYASGDQNTDDDQINNFRVDPNLETGLILYRHVLTGASGHAPIAASDPNLIGYPAQDLERLANNRSISNTIAFYPKAWWQLHPSVEAYGGVLFAFSEVAQIDPKNSRLAGGEPRNGFNVEPGGYLGTEYDLGVRYTPTLGKLNLNFGAEFGHFVFGDAFMTDDNTSPSPINAARFYVRSTL